MAKIDGTLLAIGLIFVMLSFITSSLGFVNNIINLLGIAGGVAVIVTELLFLKDRLKIKW